jgi:hypothetical protein
VPEVWVLGMVTALARTALPTPARHGLAGLGIDLLQRRALQRSTICVNAWLLSIVKLQNRNCDLNHRLIIKSHLLRASSWRTRKALGTTRGPDLNRNYGRGANSRSSRVRITSARPRIGGTWLEWDHLHAPSVEMLVALSSSASRNSSRSTGVVGATSAMPMAPIHSGQVAIDRVAVPGGLAVSPGIADPLQVLAQGF